MNVHRIPCGRKGCNEQGGQPVLLQHGLLSSSADWVASGPEKALAFLLADSGYDVWLGNTRGINLNKSTLTTKYSTLSLLGNTYSKRHKSMSNSEAKYWDFSWHEMAVHDIPAKIDYIYKYKSIQRLYLIDLTKGCDRQMNTNSILRFYR